MEEEYMRVINITIFGLVSWVLIFLLIRRIFSNYSVNFSMRLVSTLHAIVAFSLATLSIQDWSCLVCPIPSTSSLRHMETLAFSLSFMIYDLICNYYYHVITLDYAHHSVCILGFISGLLYQKGVSEMVTAIWISEISGPFFDLRDLLKEIGYKDTDTIFVADGELTNTINWCMLVCFATIFSLPRMVCGPYLVYVTLSADNPIFIKAMALGLVLWNAFAFYKIFRMMRYKFIKRSLLSKKTT